MYANTNLENLSLAVRLGRLERKATRQFRKMALQFFGFILVAGFSLYWTMKLLMKLGWLLFEAPKLRRQIQPGLFEEVSNEKLNPTIWHR